MNAAATANQENPSRTETVLTVRRVEIPPRPVSLEASLQIEHKLLLKRVTAFSMFMELFTVLLLLYVKKTVSLTTLFIVMYAYLIYYIIETMVRITKPRRTDWKAREDLLKAMNAGNGIIFLIFIQLNTSNIFKGTAVAFIPFVIAFGVYLKYSKAPYQLKTFEVLINIAYGFQILMICAKIQGIISWDWLFTFSLFLMYLGVSVVHFFTLAFTLLTLGLYTVLRVSTNFTMERQIKVIGTIWHFLYFGLGVTLFIMILGVANAYTSAVSNKVILEISAYFGICVSGLLMIVTLLFPRKLIQYLSIYYRLTQIHLEQFNNSDRRNVEIKASPETERKTGYFSIVSPTYFQPLQKGSLLKDSLNLTRIKQMLRSLKFGGIIFQSENIDRKTADKSVYLQELRNSKVKLDQVLDQKSPLRITALKKRSSEVDVIMSKIQPESKSLNDLENNIEPNMKLQFSANDLNVVTNSEKSSLSKAK